MKLLRFVRYVVALHVSISLLVAGVTGSTDPVDKGSSGKLKENDHAYNESNTKSDENSFQILESIERSDSSDSNDVHETKHNSPDDSGKVTEIHASFEEVSKSDVPSENVAVNDRLPVFMNQGTVSEDLSDTFGLLSKIDSATSELKNRMAPVSADVRAEGIGNKDPANNVSDEYPPPSDSSLSHSSSGPELVTRSSSLPSSGFTHQPPVVRAKPKVVKKLKDSKAADLDDDPPLTEDDSVAPSSFSETSTKASEPITSSGGSIDLVGVPTSDTPHEEIPSFSEWTQKQLEEAEKKKGQNKTSSSSLPRTATPSKVRSKNYASPDCGAKIVAANPEAENPNAVLSNSKDEYVLNKCSTQRMWLIIELCEAVQAKKLELANFELFSSSPKDFTVSLSHNFPSREWSSVGQFSARDERSLQSFNLNPHLFGKYLKVEFNSHHGREHFCCTSVIRVYGTSEFEALETENDAPDVEGEEEADEDEQPIGVDMGKPAKNLFGHATEAVYSIVKKAAEVLVKSGDSQNQRNQSEQQLTTAVAPAEPPPPPYCSTLRHLIVCNDCSEDFFDRVYHLLSCRSRDLQALIETPFVLDGINSSQLCSLYGLDFILRRSITVPLRLKHDGQLDQAGYLEAMLPPEYISALCNILAVLEGKVVLNSSHPAAAEKGLNLTIRPPQHSQELRFKRLFIEHQVAPTCSMDDTYTSQCDSNNGKSAIRGTKVIMNAAGEEPVSQQHSSVASQIKPTKTFTKDDGEKESIAPLDTPDVSRASMTPDVQSAVESRNVVTAQPSVVFVSNQERKSSPTDVPGVGLASSIASEAPDLDQSALETVSVAKELTDSADGLDAGPVEDQEPSKDLDAIFQEMKALNNNEETSTDPNTPSSGSAPPSNVVAQTRVPAQQAQKESVFLRLSNKIKALERNMSLSGQYLEELSRRYKKQEELGRALNKTLNILREEVRRSREKETNQDHTVSLLRSQLLELSAIMESLQVERGSWQQKAAVVSQHVIVILVEVVMIGLVLWICRRLPADPATARSPTPFQRKLSRSHGKLKRRNSFQDLRGSCERKQRRPSEELLHMAGSHQDLLLKEDHNVVVVEGVDMTPGADSSSWSAVVSNRDQRRKRKRRKDLLVRSNSSQNLAQLTAGNSTPASRKISAPSHSFSMSAQSSLEDYIPLRKIQPIVSSKQLTSSSEAGKLNQCTSESALVPNCVSDLTGNGDQSIDSAHMVPSFIQTAVSARSRRSFDFGESQSPQLTSTVPEWDNRLDAESESSASHQSSQSRSLDDQPLEKTSGQSDGPTTSVNGGEKKKKGHKKGGLKSMVKKFF